MNDQRFIELVNLYIDRQITTAEADELEHELQGNAARRAVYQQYCRMHRATKLVYENFRAHAPEEQSALLAVGQGSVARFESPRSQRRNRWAYYAGGLAAAACFGLMLTRVNTADTTAASLMANLSPKPAVYAQAQPAAVAVASVPAEDAPDGLPAPAVRATGATPTDYAVLLASVREEEQRALANGQIQSNRSPSLFDDGVFESNQLLPVNGQRVFRGRQSPNPATEFTAFQFQR